MIDIEISENLQQLLTRSESLKKVGGLKTHKGYVDLCKLTPFLSEDSYVKTRIWHVTNNIFQIPKCKKCNKNNCKWNKDLGTYSTYCSIKCARNDEDIKEKTKKTNLSKYGRETGFDYNLIKKNNFLKYGVENISQVEEIKQKKKQTSFRNYGTSHYLQSNEGKQKLKNTNLKKYGVDNPRKSPEIIKKIQKKRSIQQNSILEKTKKTNINKYGVDWNISSIQSKTKAKQTINTKYGVDYISHACVDKNSLEKLNNKEWMYNEHINLKKTLTQISEELNVGDITVGRYLHNHGIKTKHFYQSTGEKEIVDFVKTITLNIELNSRKIICPLELDIYLPDHKLAIEYCGLYWHSEQAGKDKWYHHNKYKKCADLGIQLITIYHDEWANRQLQIKNKILSLLKTNNTDKVFARKCNIVLIPTKDKQMFFEQYHIQGDGSGSINIGLIHKNILVACMSFIKQKNNIFVLNRYATSIHVVGGFSKLLKYFESNFEWKQLISFADLRWSQGNLYNKTGWMLDKILPPDYYYSPDGHLRVHKFNYRRKYLPILLKNFDPNKSENQNCNDNNILKIWDCGKFRFIKINNQ